MAVDYCARKAAKKQRRRIAAGGGNEATKRKKDGAAGGEGGGKDKKQRPKRGRSGPRRLCQGMCYQVPKLSDDDITWRSNDDDGERGSKVYDPRAPPPPREAELAAAAAARVLDSGAAEAREILDNLKGEGIGRRGGKVEGVAGVKKRNRKKVVDESGGAKAKVKAKSEIEAPPATPAAPAPPRPPPRLLSTGAAIKSFAAPGPPTSSPSSSFFHHPTLDRQFDLSTLPLALRMLAAACGLEAPTRVQSSAWAMAMGAVGGKKIGGKSISSSSSSPSSAYRNLLIVAPPGAGKTLAYLLPAAAKVVVEQDESDSDDDDDDDDDDDGSDNDADELEKRRRQQQQQRQLAPSSTSSLPPSPGVLVLVPTRELARQVAQAASHLRRAAGIRVVRVAGGDRREDQVDKLLMLRKKGKKSDNKNNKNSSSVHVLVATPGRLLDLIRGGDVGLASTHTVVLDEADKMLASSGLAEQLDEVRGIIFGEETSDGASEKTKTTTKELPQCILASATMPASVARRAAAWLGEHEGRDYSVARAGDTSSLSSSSLSPSPSSTTTTVRTNSESLVTQVVTVCAEHKKPAKLLKHLARVRAAASAAGERHAPRVLVFANRIKTVKFVAELLRKEERKERERKRAAEEEDEGNRRKKKKTPSPQSSSKIETLHGERSQPERNAALAAFRAGKVTVLVATDVAARGLDVSRLRHVVNYDFPTSLEGYEHRVGRAGRDGAGGHVASFFGRAMAPMARGVVEFLGRHAQGVDPNLVRLAEAYEVAREKMMVVVEGGGGGGGGSDDDDDDDDEVDVERSRRAAAARSAAAENKRASGGKERKRKKVEDEEEEEEGGEDDDDEDEDDEDDDDEEEEEQKPRQLGLYRKASASASAKTASATKKTTAASSSSSRKKKHASSEQHQQQKKRKALPGRLRKKLKREQEHQGETRGKRMAVL